MRSFIAAAAIAASTLANLADYDNTSNGATWEPTLCQTGKSQSPIDLYHTKEATEGLALWMEEYSPAGDVPEEEAGAERDFTWKYNYADNKGSLYLWKQDWTEKRAYNSLQFHFHSPSEHTIDGKLQDAEMHIVHQNADTKEIAVVGLLFDVVEGAKSNWFIEQMMAHYEDSSSKDVEMGKFLAGIDTSKFWSYDGSFTTPPCTEGVMWSVLSEIQEISQEQLDEFQEIYKASTFAQNGNNRQTQPMNGRVLSQAMGDGNHMDKDMHHDMKHDDDMHAQEAFLGIAITSAVMNGLDVFRYKAADDYYTDGEVLGTNYWKISNQISGYGSVAFWSIASVTQLLSMFEIGVQYNIMWWTGVGMAMQLPLGIAGMMKYYAYDRSWAITQDSSNSSADIISATAVEAAAKDEMVSMAVYDSMTAFELYMYAEDWMQGQWMSLPQETRNKRKSQKGKDFDEMSGKDTMTSFFALI